MTNQERKAVNEMLARNNELVEVNGKLLEACKTAFAALNRPYADIPEARRVLYAAIKEAEE
jgi:hypothetical protein